MMLSLLLDYGIRSTLLLGLAGAVVLALRGRSASCRHMVWLAGLMALLALPAAKVIAPQWNTPNVTQRLLAAPVRTVINVTASAERARTFDWLLIAWIGGVAFFLARGARAQALASGLAKRTVAGPQGARISNETTVPIVCGLFRPVIILPTEARHWPEERLESVLRHERMHIARRDTVAQALAQMICALYWPQPLAWLAACAMRNACEQACDDGVISQGTKPSTYARHLIEIARSLNVGTIVFEGGIAMTRTNQLEERIAALLNSSRDRRPAGASFAAAVTALAVTVVMTLAAVQTPLFAQSGRLAGVIHDASGAVVPKARIDVRKPLEGGKTMHEVVYSNDAGEFSLDVPDGSYDISVAAPGFAKQDHQGVLFQSATAKRMDMTLAVGSIRETMQVQAPVDGQKLAAERAALAGQFVPRPDRIRVGGNVQAANLVRKVTPLYPATAKLDHVEGTVIMTAVISKEGNVLSLEQVNKLVDPRLAEAAMEAVKQWQYKPTLLNGQPIEVITQIDVNFTLTR